VDEPVWLNRVIVEAIHAGQVSEHGGQAGLRDEGLLESALARPRHVWSYAPEAGLPRLAAEYGFGLARNHAFLDGNKRTAFVAMNVFLILNGYEIETAEAEVVDVMLRLAAGSLDLDVLAQWIAATVVPYSG
jgi:death on curing protein